jgi:hypothetical protein
LASTPTTTENEAVPVLEEHAESSAPAEAEAPAETEPESSAPADVPPYVYMLAFCSPLVPNKLTYNLYSPAPEVLETAAASTASALAESEGEPVVASVSETSDTTVASPPEEGLPEESSPEESPPEESPPEETVTTESEGEPIVAATVVVDEKAVSRLRPKFDLAC